MKITVGAFSLRESHAKITRKTRNNKNRENSAKCAKKRVAFNNHRVFELLKDCPEFILNFCIVFDCIEKECAEFFCGNAGSFFFSFLFIAELFPDCASDEFHGGDVSLSNKIVHLLFERGRHPDSYL